MRGEKGRGDWEDFFLFGGGGGGGGWRGVEGKTGEDLNVWRQGRNLNVLRVGGGTGGFPIKISPIVVFMCYIF